MKTSLHDWSHEELEVLRRAAEKQKELAKTWRRGPKKDDLVRMSIEWWKVSYGKCANDDEEGAKRELDALLLERCGDENLGLLPNVQLQAHAHAAWAQNGMRQVVMNHKTAASLMCTKMSDDVLKDLLPPWPAFLIDVPSEMLYTKDEDELVEISCVLVMRYRWRDGTMRWAYVAYGRERPITLWRYGLCVEMLVEPEKEGAGSTTELGQKYAFSEKIDELDKRVEKMLGRLIAGTCLAMTNRESVREPKEKKSDGYNERKSPLPKIRTYQLRYSASVDCREAVRDFVLHNRIERKGLSVQTLVAGHWKNQAWGPGRTKRKWIHVEPYWRGPEDAPIAAVSVKVNR